MRKIVLISMCIILCVCILGCVVKEEYYICPDNLTRVTDPNSCPGEKRSCPPSCDDIDNCTLDKCSAATDYKCFHEEISPCDGNNLCEAGEFPWSRDCPESCDDKDECTIDSYNYEIGICLNDKIVPCCGNRQCDAGETYVTCSEDCEQLLDIRVIHYERRERFPASFGGNLVGTDKLYLVVKFTIHNIGVDSLEELNYRKERGFFYDPFKMRLEDDHGTLYNVEYDSDILDDWLDYFIIPKGDMKHAELLFVVSRNADHMRLIAYDKYGSKMDISEVY